MTLQNITFQHSLVNSGTAVSLPGATVSYKWKNITNFNPAIAKFDIVPGSFIGWENPTIIVAGTISTVDQQTNEMTQQLLVNFSTLKTTTPIVLTIPTSSSGTAESPFSATPTYIGGRPSTGYETDGTNVLSNTINVMIEDWSLDVDQSADLGHIWRYSITCREAV